MSEADASSVATSSSHESAWSDADDEQYEFKAFHDESVFDSLDSMLEHEQKSHDFDLQGLRQSLKLDLYASIKLVNHVRRTKASASEIRMNIENIKSDDTLLKPSMENDAVLFHLVDDQDEAQNENQDGNSLGSSNIDWKQKFDALQAQYQMLQQTMMKNIEARPASEDKPDNDSYYFDSYGYNDIHETMLKDAVRTDAYRDAVYDNKDIFKNKTVLDVGCGTGILSMFCAKAGAKHVYAIDNSNIIDKARSNAYENGLDDNITFIKGKVEDVELPSGCERVDIIISEWMGYALLYESMLDSVLVARDRFLAPGGLMMPSLTTLVLAGLSDKEYFDDRVNFWSDIYGFKMGAMKDGIFDDILIDSLPATSLGTEPVVFESLDLHKVAVQDLIFKNAFELKPCKGQTSIIAFHIWFDTFFTRSPGFDESTKSLVPIKGSARMKDGNAFSTGPYGTATHWKQAVLLIDGEIKVPEGHEIRGQIEYRKGANNSRFLEIVIDWRVHGADDEQSTTRSQVWHLA